MSNAAAAASAESSDSGDDGALFTDSNPAWAGSGLSGASGDIVDG